MPKPELEDVFEMFGLRKGQPRPKVCACVCVCVCVSGN